MDMLENVHINGNGQQILQLSVSAIQMSISRKVTIILWENTYVLFNINYKIKKSLYKCK